MPGVSTDPAPLLDHLEGHCVPGNSQAQGRDQEDRQGQPHGGFGRPGEARARGQGADAEGQGPAVPQGPQAGEARGEGCLEPAASSAGQGRRLRVDRRAQLRGRGAAGRAADHLGVRRRGGRARRAAQGGLRDRRRQGHLAARGAARRARPDDHGCGAPGARGPGAGVRVRRRHGLPRHGRRERREAVDRGARLGDRPAQPRCRRTLRGGLRRPRRGDPRTTRGRDDRQRLEDLGRRCGTRAGRAGGQPDAAAEGLPGRRLHGRRPRRRRRGLPARPRPGRGTAGGRRRLGGQGPLAARRRHLRPAGLDPDGQHARVPQRWRRRQRHPLRRGPEAGRRQR